MPDSSDKTLLDHINELVREEHDLREARGQPHADEQRLKKVEEELDQCWDLLRQRRAKREFGDDPDSAQPRDVKTVEGYIG